MRFSNSWPILLLLAGCSGWPPHGQGGLAELRPPPREDDSPSVQRFAQHDNLKELLDRLRGQGADACFPAYVLDLQNALNGVLRELHGGMGEDAQARLPRIEAQLASLDADLHAGRCQQAGLSRLAAAPRNGTRD